MNINNADPLGILLNSFEEDIFSGRKFYHPESPEHYDSYREIVHYLNSFGSRRRNYRYYASHKRINNILDESFLYLSDGSCWNDKHDRENFNPPYLGFKNFGICLSATSDESIAMWMLYGGLDGNGAMINFDRHTLDTIRNATSYECGYFDKNNTFKSIVSIDSKLVDFSLIDILYYSSYENDHSKVLLKRGRKGKGFDVGSEAFSKIIQSTKHKSWSYENEVRLVASIDKLRLGSDSSKTHYLKVPISLSKDFIVNRVFDSPTSDRNERFRNSDLTGTVDWDLCASCGYKLKS